MELGLKGKIALVTGSSRGIGAGTALALAAEGCDLMLTGRDEKALDEVAQAIREKGRRAAVAVLDLRAKDAPEALIAAVRREFGALDILFSNAGTTKRGDFFTLTDADWEEGYALKFFAHVRLARVACRCSRNGAARWSPWAAPVAANRTPTSPSAVRSMRRSRPLPNAWPIAARSTACK
jgi:NAD(P)-dependent dehydrogenase (short-subunit alcohol dehydrogenase family)